MHAVIDTNIIIYDTIEDSLHHQESKELLNNLCISNNFSLSRFNDMVILSVAKKKNFPIITFDNKLRKNAKSLNIEVFPKEI